VNQDGFKLSGTHQLLDYADDVDVLGGSVHTTVKPVLNGISRDQNIFPLKPGYRLIKVHYIQYKKLNQDMQTLTLR